MNRHVEALAEEFLGRGHDVRVLAPVDPPGRLSRALHRAPAERLQLPDYLIPLGRTMGFGANGSISNLAPFPAGGVVAPRRLVRSGEFDVIHVHEPVVPLVGWNATLGAQDPVVGTFHTYSTKPVPNYIANALGARRVFNRLSARIAVSEAAAWTGRRWFGGEYTIVPNGVDVDAAPSEPKPAGSELRILFVGRSDERKGLPILLTAFNALVEHVPCRLTVIGTDREEVLRYVADPDLLQSMDIRGRVSREDLWKELHRADLLCAPSLSGESFGMVLTEAFAAGTPVIASAIAGYSDVVSDGVDGLLVPPGDPQRLAEELQRAHYEPERLQAMGEAARRSAQRYAWPRVADQVTAVYERAIEAPKPATSGEKVAHWAGLRPADGQPKRPAERLPSLDPPLAQAGNKGRAVARRLGLAVAGIMGVGLALLAARRIGIDNVVESIVRSNLTWVLVACALMAASLFFRA
ncbi:MAG TPA: glycosyltransferase family 4 protein, partial [Solirubrobacterales bacterium]